MSTCLHQTKNAEVFPRRLLNAKTFRGQSLSIGKALSPTLSTMPDDTVDDVKDSEFSDRSPFPSIALGRF